MEKQQKYYVNSEKRVGQRGKIAKILRKFIVKNKILYCAK